MVGTLVCRGDSSRVLYHVGNSEPECIMKGSAVGFPKADNGAAKKRCVEEHSGTVTSAYQGADHLGGLIFR